MGTIGNGTSARWDWSFDATSEGVLVLRLSGSWRKHDHLPTRAAIEHGLGARRNARALAFDTRGIETWDSGFVVFVRQVVEAGRALQLAEDLTGLPVRVRKLLDLAAAVPEHETGRGLPPARLLARFGTAGARAAEGAREMITFLGEACLALMRFATERARLIGRRMQRRLGPARTRPEPRR